MDLSFANLLYSGESLDKPKGILAEPRRSLFPGEAALQEAIPDFDARYKIRYNARGGYAYGAITKEDMDKTILAITKTENGYRYKLIEAEAAMANGSWSRSQNDGFQEVDMAKLIQELLTGGTAP